MGKKKKEDRWSLPDLPPEGLWISPAGKRESVNEHLMAIAERPDLFGLSRREVEGADEAVLRKIAERLIAQGWTRYRYLDGKYMFEVDDARRRTGTIEEVLMSAHALPQEGIFVVQFSPHMEYEGTVGDLYERSLFRFANKKPVCKWAFSYGHGRKVPDRPR